MMVHADFLVTFGVTFTLAIGAALVLGKLLERSQSLDFIHGYGHAPMDPDFFFRTSQK